uniref:HIVEP zinc finger 2a n=1 Tax=Oryzias sinensis TaxID=183150 RepID=A0A8C7XR40_9TELE
MDPHDSTVTRQKGSNRDEVKEKIPLQRKWASEPSANTKQNTFCDPEVKGSTPQQKYPMTGNPVQLLSGPSGVGAIGGPPSADPQGPLTQGFPRGYPYQLGQPYPQHPQTERFLSGAKPQPGLESHAWPFAGQLPSDDPYGHPGHTHLHKAGRFPRQKSPSLPSSFGQYSQSGLEPGEEGYSKKEQKPKKPGKYICHYCGRACAKPSVLKKHIRSHTGERPYPCEPCGFSFKTKSNLYKHRKSHAHAIKAGLVPFSSELAVTHSEDVGQASPVGEGEAPSDGEQSTDTDEEGVEGSTMLMEKHSPIPQISFEANKTAGGGEPAYADSAEEFHIGSMKVPILIFPKPGVAGGRSHSLDDSSSSKRLAQRMDEKKVQDSDPSISQSLNLLSPHSKGSTDSGYFSPYDSAELQIGTPNTSAKTYEEIMFGRTWYNRPNSRPRQSMTVGMAAADGNGSLKQQDLDMCEIAEDPSSFKDSLGMSGDAKQYPTGPCQSSTGLLEPPSESGTLIRSRSMPAPVPSNLNTPQGIRGSISFDNMVAPDDVFYPPGQPKLKRQSAFEHPANESHPGEAEGHPHMAKGLASSVGLKITERCPGGPEDIFYNQHPSRVSISEIATRKRRKEKSVGDDEDSPENCDSSFSSSVDILGDYDFKQGSFDGSRGTPTGKSSFHSTHSQSDSFDTCVSMCSDDVVPFPDSEGRKPVGNVISVIQHTNSLSRPNSFEKSESFEQPVHQPSDKAPSSHDSDLASFSSSSAAASPGQPYHKLVRQPNIQVPEIRVTEEPDKPEKDTEPVVTKEPEKQPPAVEEFQLPQRSDTLSQMPTEKLPPKKKRLRLADMEYSSGESSFESTCTSLSRSPSQESNLSHSSSMSMSFEKDEGVKSVSPTKQVPTKQSEFLTVPSSFSSHHQQREMRRSSSEQAPCTLPTELPEMRSKSFDYGSLPSCRQGEVYTSTSAKKERRRGYLVRQASLSVYPEGVLQDIGGGQVSIKQENLEHGVWPLPSGSPHSSSEMAIRPRRPGNITARQQQQLQKLHLRSPSSLPGPAAPKQSAQQVYDPPLYEEKTEHQSTHIYSPSFPSHINMLSPAPSMLQRHLQPTQNLSSKTTSPGLVVPVRIQTYVPVFGSATYTSVSQFMSSHGNEADALGADRGENSTLGAVRPCNPPGGISRSGFNLSLLLGHTDIDLLCSSFWKGSEKHLNTGIPLSLTSGTISTTDASGSAIGGGKRMLSPTSSLELFIQSKQQKRVKEERMYGQIVKEMSAVELSGAERGTTPEKQGGRNQRAPLRGKDSVDECERMSSSPPLSDPPAATKIAVPVRSSAPHLSDVPQGDSFPPPLQIVTERGPVSCSQDSPERLDVDDVSPGPSSSPEPMLSSSDADSSDKQALLLKPAPTHSSGMTGGAQSLLFTNLSEVQQLLHFPSLRTTSRVSWCFRNYTKPNSTQAASHCSVYSSWSVSTHNPNPLNISTKAALALLRSKQRENTEWLFTMAAMCPPSSGKLVSSVAWKLMFDQLKPDLGPADLNCFGRKMKGVESWERSKVELGEKVASAKQLSTEPTRIKIFEGGYKSNEDYVYVRGRGRGKYICEECGIRCKKPSMLKKHIRTHTDVRPYVCKFCNFAFKTKGNLTKHMKSKAHIKKCLELGVSMSSVEDTEAEEGGRRSHMNLLLLTPASGYAAGVVEGIGGFLGWVTGLLPLEQGSGTYGSFDGHMWLADKSLIILFFSLDQSLSGVMRCQRRAVVAVLGVKTISLLLSIISQSLYQPETCELPCLKLRAPVSEEERAVSGTGSVRKKAGGGLWGQAAGESCRDGKNVKPTARHSLQRVSVCLVPCLHVISLSHIYRTFRPKIPFKVSTPA